MKDRSKHKQRKRGISTAESAREYSFQETHALLEYEEPISLDSTIATQNLSPRSSSSLVTLDDEVTKESNNNKLMLVFVLLIIFGSGNTILSKLSAIPMYNYPNFLNLWGTWCYIPLCFAYIWPMTKLGKINTSPEPISKRPFAIMGALDCVTSLLQTFASVYLPGSLLVLLPQAAIPMSLLLSNRILGSKYKALQYLGALVVVIGIVVVLEPVMTGRHDPDHVCQAINMDQDCTICQLELDEQSCLSHRLDSDPTYNVLLEFEKYLQTLSDTNDDDDEGQSVCHWVSSATASGDKQLVVMWSMVMIVSCIPMTLSSIYKEIALQEEIDPIYLNGWIAIFQLLFSVLLSVPGGMASSPPVQPRDVPENIWDGFQCYLGIPSIHNGCHPDDYCQDHAGLLVNFSLFFNVGTTLCMMYVLKYGSASLFYLALTVMVPIGNLAFGMLPNAAPFHVSDIVGLVVIVGGLILYRCSSEDKDDREAEDNLSSLQNSTMKDLKQPLLSSDV